MKKELLEHLIRQCVREVITQVNEVSLQRCPKCHAATSDSSGKVECTSCDWSAGSINEDSETPTHGESPSSPKSPDDMRLLADIPKDTSAKDGESPNEPSPNPETSPAPDLKGVVFVNPKDKAKLHKIKLSGMDDAAIERSLHGLAAAAVGQSAKISISAIRGVKDAIKNPNTSVYIYLGKHDPNSDEIFLMSDKSLQVAKDSSITASEITGNVVAPISPQQFDPSTASAEEFYGRAKQQGKSPAHTVNESLTELIRKVVNNILDN